MRARSQCEQTSAVCRSLVLLALGWARWSGNAYRRRTQILAMVANTDKGSLASSNKNIVSKLLI
jgi:hypothetical protein